MALVKWKFLRSFYFVNICAELPLVLEMCEYACFVSIGLWREKSTFEQNETKEFCLNLSSNNTQMKNVHLLHHRAIVSII